ncbi:MAG TPA: lasso peptide biosynthesis B2 protein [Chloroflexota bacterium]
MAFRRREVAAVRRVAPRYDLGRAAARATGRFSVADVWLAARIACWALALPVLKFWLPLPTLARLMWVGGRGPARGAEGVEKVVALTRWICRAGGLRAEGNCLERGLLLYRFLSAMDARPRLVVGARVTDEGVLGHVWVTVGGWPVGEPTTALDGFTPIVVFGDGGRPLPRA